MELLFKTIRKTAAGRLPQEFVEEFIRTIGGWSDGVRAYFFQMSEASPVAVLEFGAHVGEALIDISGQPGRLKTSVIPVAAIQGLELIDKEQTTEFFIRSAGTEDIRYHAVMAPEREQLRRYAREVERIFAGRERTAPA